MWDPETGQVKRIRKDGLLPRGARVLLPKTATGGEDRRQATYSKNSPSSISSSSSSRQPLSAPPIIDPRVQAAADLLRESLILDSPDFLALNKPAGLAVQGGTGVGMSVDSLLPLAFPAIESRGRAKYGDARWLRLAHRLDKGATGVLLVGKGPDATARLAEAFREKSESALGKDKDTISTIERDGDMEMESSSAISPSSSSSRFLSSQKRDRGGDSLYDPRSGSSRSSGVDLEQVPEVEKLYWAVVCREQEGDDGTDSDVITDTADSTTSTSTSTRWKESLKLGDNNKNNQIDNDVEDSDLWKGKKGAMEAPVGVAVGPPGASHAARSTTDPIGDPALTRYRVIDVRGPLAWLELEPITGRKHQLRQHCAWELGAPVLGDSRYGTVRREPQRSVLRNLLSDGDTRDGIGGGDVPLLLHCREIILKVPGQRVVRAVAPVPEVWRRLADAQGWRLPSRER